MLRKFLILTLISIGSVYSNRLNISSDYFSVLLNDLPSSYGTFDRIVPMPDQGGSFINDVYLITTSTGAELVFKAENPNWELRKTLNEVSSIRYIEQNTNIPVPHIVKYQHEVAASPLGTEYILMTRVQGKALNLVIEEIYPDKKIYLNILNELADVVAKLHSIRFASMGNLENKDNELIVVSPIEFPQSVISTPCHKFSDYAFAWLSYYTNEMKRLKTANHPHQQYFSRLLLRLENILKTKDFSTLDEPEDIFVYCHQDFVMKNILIDQDCVSAILDWEWSGPALPEFEVQTGFDFLLTEEDRNLFAKLMAERGFPNFFRPPSSKRQLFYDLIGHLYALISCQEWIEGKLDHSAKFLAQKLEQRMVKSNKQLNLEKFVNEKTEIVAQLLETFEFSQKNQADGVQPAFLSEIYQKPIALFGLSGVGKTTLAHGLVNLAPDQFSLIPITTSRSPRADDDLQYMEFLSAVDFISNQDEGCFAVSWHQDGNYYGYRRAYLENTKKSPIMTCSLSAIGILKEYGALTVFIKGDGLKGLEARGADEITKKRILLNKKNTEKYLNQPGFKQNIDVEQDQIWGDTSRSIQNLYDSLITKIFRQ